MRQIQPIPYCNYNYYRAGNRRLFQLSKNRRKMKNGIYLLSVITIGKVLPEFCFMHKPYEFFPTRFFHFNSLPSLSTTIISVIFSSFSFARKQEPINPAPPVSTIILVQRIKMCYKIISRFFQAFVNIVGQLFFLDDINQ